MVRWGTRQHCGRHETAMSFFSASQPVARTTMKMRTVNGAVKTSAGVDRKGLLRRAHHGSGHVVADGCPSRFPSAPLAEAERYDGETPAAPRRRSGSSVWEGNPQPRRKATQPITPEGDHLGCGIQGLVKSADNMLNSALLKCPHHQFRAPATTPLNSRGREDAHLAPGPSPPKGIT